MIFRDRLVEVGPGVVMLCPTPQLEAIV